MSARLSLFTVLSISAFKFFVAIKFGLEPKSGYVRQKSGCYSTLEQNSEAVTIWV